MKDRYLPSNVYKNYSSMYNVLDMEGCGMSKVVYVSHLHLYICLYICVYVELEIILWTSRGIRHACKIT